MTDKKDNTGRPRVPRWDEMHDIDKLLHSMQLAQRNIHSGKWKETPRSLVQIWDRMRELLMNKYPDYYRPMAPMSIKESLPGTAPSEPKQEVVFEPPLKTPEQNEPEVSRFTFPQGTLPTEVEVDQSPFEDQDPFETENGEE